jgi:bifunctional non-homologous end joining protein LigD
MILETKESIFLHYRDARSDKVYQIQLDRAEGGYVVNFQFGRRGASLQSGTKTAQPVPIEKARKVYEGLIAEKKGKGYTEAETGTPYEGTPQAGKQSGLLPQLLNPIDEREANRMIAELDFIMQEKKDGRRLLVRKAGAKVEGVNRKGQFVALPAEVANAVQLFDCDVVLDGESVGDIYWVFDLLELRGEDLRTMSTSSRLIALNHLLHTAKDNMALHLVPTAWVPEDKRKLFEQLKSAKAEGMVFKHIDAGYVPGRPNSGGTHLKFKLTASCTCRVMGRNEGKRSVSVAVHQHPGDGFVDVGNVTIPPNFPVPQPGDLAEIRYLYAFPGGSLYQPVYLGLRTDVDCADSVKSLKFRQDEDDES